VALNASATLVNFGATPPEPSIEATGEVVVVNPIEIRRVGHNGIDRPVGEGKLRAVPTSDSNVCRASDDLEFGSQRDSRTSFITQLVKRLRRATRPSHIPGSNISGRLGLVAIGKERIYLKGD
jgi:hypothetical protein